MLKVELYGEMKTLSGDNGIPIGRRILILVMTLSIFVRKVWPTSRTYCEIEASAVKELLVPAKKPESRKYHFLSPVVK